LNRAIGLLFIVAGALMLLGGPGTGGLLGELLWLAALSLIAASVYRALAARKLLRFPLVAMPLFGMLAAATSERLAGPGFLWFLAWGFWLIYGTPTRIRPVTAWALIPAGVLSTITAAAAIAALAPAWDAGVVFLLGMTATFGAIYLLPRERGGGRWALAPALVWALLTVLANDPSGALARWILPLALIGGGVALLGWTRRR
jgi:hypothetical protein